MTFEGSVRDAVARLEGQPGVIYAQPNYRYHALAAAPNDTHFANLWGLGSTPGVGVLPAWDRSLGGGQVIAVIDTGVDLTHPDLAPNLWTGPGGVNGADFVDVGTSPDDFNLHGSHVAGTAAAVANNAQGVAGVAPQAQIMAMRALDGDGCGSSSGIAEGIAFAANNGGDRDQPEPRRPRPAAGDQAMSDAIALAETRGCGRGRGGREREQQQRRLAQHSLHAPERQHNLRRVRDGDGRALQLLELRRDDGRRRRARRRRQRRSRTRTS